MYRNLKNDMRYVFAICVSWLQIESTTYGERDGNSVATNELLNHIIRCANGDGETQVKEYFSALGLSHNNGSMAEYMCDRKHGTSYAYRLDPLFRDYDFPYTTLDAIRTTSLQDVYGAEQVKDAIDNPLPMMMMYRKWWAWGESKTIIRKLCKCGNKSVGHYDKDHFCTYCSGTGHEYHSTWWESPVMTCNFCYHCKGLGWMTTTQWDGCYSCDKGVIEQVFYGTVGYGHTSSGIKQHANYRLSRYGFMSVVRSNEYDYDAVTECDCGDPECSDCYPDGYDCDCGEHDCSYCYPNGCDCDCADCYAKSEWGTCGHDTCQKCNPLEEEEE